MAAGAPARTDEPVVAEAPGEVAPRDAVADSGGGDPSLQSRVDELQHCIDGMSQDLASAREQIVRCSAEAAEQTAAAEAAQSAQAASAAALARERDHNRADIRAHTAELQAAGARLTAYLRGAGRQRGGSPLESQLLHAELRAARSKMRVMGGEAVATQLKMAVTASEAKDHAAKRRWLEQKLSDVNQTLSKANNQLQLETQKVDDLVLQRNELRELRDRNTLQIAELELQVTLRRHQADLAAEQEEMLRREQKKIVVQLEAAHTTLDSLSKAQDPRIVALREDLSDFIDVQRRRTGQQAEHEETGKRELEEKRITHAEQLTKLDSELREASKALREQEHKESAVALPEIADRKADDATAQNPSNSATSQAELTKGMQDLALQRQILMWLGLAVDMDAVDNLGLASPAESAQVLDEDERHELATVKKPDIASRAVASVLLAHRANVPAAKEATARTLVDLGIVAAYYRVKTGSGFKEFTPSDTGLHKLHSELEAQIKAGAHLSLAEQEARNRANRLFQCAVRAKNARRRFARRKEAKLRNRAAQTIQSHYRGRLGRAKVVKLHQEHLQARSLAFRQKRVDLAEKDIIDTLGSDDEDETIGDEEASRDRLRQANCSYRQLIRSLPAKTVASLSKHTKHGPLYALLLMAVLGKKQYERAHKNRTGSGLEFADEDPDDRVAKMRHRIWQLESDVAALLLVDARRRLADRRKQLVGGGTVAMAPRGALPSDGQTLLTTRPSTSLASGQDDEFLQGWGAQNSLKVHADPDSWARPVSRTSQTSAVSPTLTERIRQAQQRRLPHGSAYHKGKGKSTIIEPYLPLLDAALAEAQVGAGCATGGSTPMRAKASTKWRGVLSTQKIELVERSTSYSELF